MTPAVFGDPGNPEQARYLTRLTGAFYLIIIVCGVWSEGIVRASFVNARGDLAIVEAVSQQLGLFRLSIASDTIMVLADIAVAMLFLHMLRAVAPLLALMTAGLRLAQAATIAASLILLSAVPSLLSGPNSNLVPVLFEMHAIGYDIGLILFGVNSLLMAVLLRRAGDVPLWICGALGLAGLVYLGGSYLRLLAPGLHAQYQMAYLVPLVAETALCLWLLLTGRMIAAKAGTRQARSS